MPRKQRFKPSRKPKLADGTTPLTPVSRPTSTVGPESTSLAPTEPVVRPVRGRDAIIDD